MPGVACRVEHWRAQPKVGSFRSPLFRLWSGFLIRPSPTFPAAPPQIPYGGFSPVRLQAQAPRSTVCRLPPRSPHLSLIPDIPAAYSTFTPAFETIVHQPGCPPLCADLWRCPSPPEPRGPRSSRVVLSLPSSLGDLIRPSDDLHRPSQHG